MRPLPLYALRAFEAAARQGAFNRSAAELNVSPTAISHHIRALEEELGCALFSRRARGVHLTEAGRRLAERSTIAFAELREAVEEARATTARPVLTLALGPILAARWLSPRLSSLFAAFSDVELRIVSASQGTAVLGQSTDLQILWGDGNWPDLHVMPFLNLTMVPVASPTLARRLNGRDPVALVADAPLLHNRDDTDWRHWLQSAGARAPTPLPGIRINDANVLLRSCLEGQGVAIGWLPLLEPEIEAGELVMLSDHVADSPRAYFLCSNERSKKNPAAMRLMRWLVERR